MGVDGCWCAPRSSKPLQVVRSCPGGFDSHILSPTGTGAAALLRFLCISTPQSNLRFASSPAGEPFGIVQAPPKSCPRLRGKCRGASRDERGTARRCHAVLAFPLSLTSFDSSPAGGGAFWRSTNTAYSAVPLRGAIVSMGLRGPKGRNRNLPWPPGKTGYKVACSAFCLFYSLRLLVSLASTSFDREAFSIAKLRMCFPNIPQIIAYMLKLTSISCFSIVMPIYIDNLMIMGYLITIRRGLCMKEINSFG